MKPNQISLLRKISIAALALSAVFYLYFRYYLKDQSDYMNLLRAFFHFSISLSSFVKYQEKRSLDSNFKQPTFEKIFMILFLIMGIISLVDYFSRLN